MKQPAKENTFPFSVDIVLFGYSEGALNVLLVERKYEPFAKKWALPGGFIEANETIEAAAFRELKEETGVENIKLEQFQAFNTPGRDPRGPTVTIALYGIINLTQVEVIAGDDAAKAKWWPVNEKPPLAFDHDEIYAKALKTLKVALRTRLLAFELLPKQFTLTHLQDVYEQILGTSFDRRSFLRNVSNRDYIRTSNIRNRYEFDVKRYARFSLENLL